MVADSLMDKFEEDAMSVFASARCDSIGKAVSNTGSLGF